MSKIEDLNQAIKALEDKRQKIQNYIITQPLKPGENPYPIDDINQMEKAFKEYNNALDNYRKIRANICGA